MLRDLRLISEAYKRIYSSSKETERARFIEDKDAVKDILSSIKDDTDNERLNIGQFRKYLKDPQSKWFGLFLKDRCVALCVLKKGIPQTDGIKDIVLLAEIQSIKKGYGKPLIEELLKRYTDIWWASDIEGGESLKNYYRQFKDDQVEEVKVKQSIFSKNNDEPQSFFFKASDNKRYKLIKDKLRSFDNSKNKERDDRHP